MGRKRGGVTWQFRRMLLLVNTKEAIWTLHVARCLENGT